MVDDAGEPSYLKVELNLRGLYSQRHVPFKKGIRFIEDDADYAFFLDTSLEEPLLPISIYLDHSGDGLAELFDSESDGSGNVVSGDDSANEVTGITPEEDDFPDAHRFNAGFVPPFLNPIIVLI
ncbi:hypothetical protein LXL04_033161 [Taraxacum kok-saghyz]